MAAQQSLINRWYRFSFITTDDDNSQGFVNTLLTFVNVSQVTDDGLTVEFYPHQIPANVDVDESSMYFSERDAHYNLDSVIDQILDDVIERGIWMNLAHAYGTFSTRVLYRAYLKGMLQEPYMWIYDNCREVQDFFANFTTQPLCKEHTHKR